MKVRGKKLLAAMLSLAMVLSMFVVPAAAVDLPAGKTWDWSNMDTRAETAKVQIQGSGSVETDVGDGLLVDATAGKWDGTWNNQWVQVNANTIIKVPVTDGAGYHAKITVTANGTNVLKVAGKANSEAKAQSFECVGTDGYVTIEYTANDYLASIKLEYVEGELTAEASMDLDKQEAVIKVGETVTVNATISDGTATAWDYSVEGDAVTASVSNGTVSIEGAKKGKTTVTVKATVDGKELSKTVAVRVLPAEVGTVTENKTYNFQNVNSSESAQDNYYAEGLEWSGPKLDNSHGPYGGSVTLTVHIPENKKTTLTVVTCGFSASGHTMTANSTAVDGATPDADDGNNHGQKFVVADATGTVTLAFSGGTVYVHSLEVGAFTSTTGEPDPGPSETGSVEAGTIDFQALASNVTATENINGNDYGAVPAVKGLTVGSDAVIQTNSSHGLYAKGSVTVTLNLSGVAKITLVECQYGPNKISKVTAGGTDVTLPTPTGELDKTYVFEDVSAGNFVLTLNAGAYIHSIKVEYPTTPEPEPEPEPGNGKVDVYDFGAEALDSAKFNNKLTADIINAWFEGVTPGTRGKNLPTTVTAGNLTVEMGSGSTTPHRFRTTNESLTRTDESNVTKSNVTAGQDPYDPSRTKYTGTVASNGAPVVLKLKAGKGDKLTYAMGDGGNKAYTVTFTGADSTTEEKDAPAGSGGSVFTFYAPATGIQTLTGGGTLNGARPVVARIYAEQPTAVTVSGNLTIDSSMADPTGLKLVFTNDDSGIATEATVTGSTYTVALSNYQAGTTYTVTAEGITGGAILEGKALALTAETGETASHNVTVGQVSLVDVSGTVTGLDADSLGRLKLSLTPPEGNAYVPEITLTAGAWSAQLQSGVEYTVNAENVNDYTLDTAKVKYSADATDAAIAFTAKPTYAVTIVPTGLTLDDLADATFTFTNVKETYEAANGKPASYVYTFTGANAIALRDGQYSVKVTTGKGRQELTPDVKVNGAAVNCPIEFDVTVPTVWDFSAADFTDALYNKTGDKTYNGLLIGDGLKKEGNKAHVQGGSGTIRIPVTGDCTVTVFVYYAAAGTVGVGTDTVELKTTNSTGGTGTTDPITYNYTGEDGYVDVTVTGTTYITKIETVYASDVEFKDTVTVGDGKDCATITEALALVAQMPRPNNERVTIVIDPGNYEEQLLVSVANVTLKNAKAAEAKLELKNKGVDIGDNEVRITHYYGHGYTYYSMTNGHRYSEKVLAVNKANGYPSYTNTGSGNTDNSYWNASVLIDASGFQAEGIIFENSFNQYVSAKAANDVIVPQSGAKEPANAPRASLPQGSTAVQDKTYVERAAALVIKNNATNIFFDKCAFIGRQDVLAGCAGVTAGFYNCDIYGGTDYIMEDMKAVFAKCNLVMNTSENKNDVAYITAAKNTGGYLMYNCSVISTVPGVNTASKLPSKPGTFGRPWEANCEVVFYETIVDTTTTKADGTQGTEELSLIQPIGWTEGLNGGGNFQRCVEYHTHEGVDVDTSARHANANVFDEPKRSDGSAIDYTTWLGGWNPFADKDMTVLGCPDTSRTVTFNVSSGASVTDLAADGEAKTLDSKNKLVALKEAVITFKIALTEGYTLNSVTGATWDDNSVYTVTADTVVISASRPSSGDMLPTGPMGGNKGETVTNPDGSKTTTITDKKGTTTVTTVATDGSKLETVTTKAGDKTITVTDAKGEVQVKIELPATIPAPETKFTDVPESHWAESAINDMAGLGLVKGVSESSFDTDSPITRASVATILFRLSNGAKGKTSSFTDVPAGEWYADAVAWAASAGVVNGYSETIFAPNESITREQFAVMLYRFAKLIGMDTAASGDVSKFGDAASVSEWAADAMTWCVGEGILNGTNDPVQGIALSPAKTASRAECAVMLGRFIALI